MRDAAVVAVVLFAAAGSAACHRPAAPPYTIAAPVETLDGNTLTLRHKSGQRIRIVLAGDTAVTSEGRPATPADIAVGMRVMVVYHFADAKAVADEVRLFRGPINYP